MGAVMKTAKTQNIQQQAAISLRAVDRILGLWDFNLEEKLIILGSLPKSTFYKYKDAEAVDLNHDLLERLSYILNIHAALRILFTNSESVYGWVKKPNHSPFYGGRSAFEIMMQGRVVDLWQVCSRLNAERGGWN